MASMQVKGVEGKASSYRLMGAHLSKTERCGSLICGDAGMKNQRSASPGGAEI
jgi:hypothetical protein